MKLSVVCCSKRAVPHFEWSIESLNNQTHKDFEYIIVDGLYDKRKDEVLALLKKANFPYTYVPDKPSLWTNIGPALSNARNTGFMIATGDQIVFHDDDCRFDPDWLTKHCDWAEKGYAVAGTWISYQSMNPDGTFVEGIYGLEHRAKQYTQPAECPGAWLYGANFSVPTDAMISVNGNDELYCGEVGGEDCDFGIRINRIGCQTAFDPTCIVKFLANPGNAASINRSDMTSMDLQTLLQKHPKERLLESGETHYSNEWLIQLLIKQLTRYWTLGNAFQLSDLREHWNDAVKKNVSVEDFYEQLKLWQWPYDCDWRDCQPLSEMIVK